MSSKSNDANDLIEANDDFVKASDKLLDLFSSIEEIGFKRPSEVQELIYTMMKAVYLEAKRKKINAKLDKLAKNVEFDTINEDGL